MGELIDRGKPLVSIGMLVYNGERFIRQTIESLLEQEYQNFELIISDNASTDHTQQICEEYILKDSRIHYYRNLTNIGAPANFNRVLDLAKGEYFMFASDHDLWHPRMVAHCVEPLLVNQSVVLVYPAAKMIDMSGVELDEKFDAINTQLLSPLQRYRKILWGLNDCLMIYGMFRRQAIGKQRAAHVWGPDSLFLAELSLRGEFIYLPEVLYYPRKNRRDDPSFEEYVKRQVVALQLQEFIHDPDLTFLKVSRQQRRAYFDIILKSDLSTFEKILAILDTIHCFWVRFRTW